MKSSGFAKPASRRNTLNVSAIKHADNEFPSERRPG